MRTHSATRNKLATLYVGGMFAVAPGCLPPPAPPCRPHASPHLNALALAADGHHHSVELVAELQLTHRLACASRAGAVQVGVRGRVAAQAGVQRSAPLELTVVLCHKQTDQRRWQQVRQQRPTCSEERAATQQRKGQRQRACRKAETGQRQQACKDRAGSPTSGELPATTTCTRRRSM